MTPPEKVPTWLVRSPADQLPPDSQWATLSQLTPEAPVAPPELRWVLRWLVVAWAGARRVAGLVAAAVRVAVRVVVERTALVRPMPRAVRVSRPIQPSTVSPLACW